MRPRVCVLGSFMMDLVVSAPRRPEAGETLVGTDFAMRLGGKGFNQAVAASRAGAVTSMVGMIGGDSFGTSFRVALSAEGVDGTGVGVHEPTGTGVGLPVVEPDGGNSIIIVPQANLHVSPAEVERSRDAIEVADVLLLQLELPESSAVAAARVAREAGTYVVLNPAPAREVSAELLDCVDLVVPNEVELDALVGWAVGDDVERGAQVLHERWSVDVIATLGRRGIAVRSRGGRFTRLGAHQVNAVDTVGAGDVFCGYLGAGLASGRDFVEASEWANAAAAISVTRHGSATSAPTAEEVAAFLATRTPGGAQRPGAIRSAR